MPVSSTYNLGMSKTAAGAYIRSLDIPTTLMPGNFGCRVIDGAMPTNFSIVYKERRSTLTQNFVCDNNMWKVPVLLEEPIKTDYLTDEESDDGAGFKLKMPKLSDLLNEFEVGDECLIGKETDFKNYMADLKTRGMPRTLRDNIQLEKTNKANQLGNNIDQQRRYQNAKLPGMLSEANSLIQKPN
jgi:hypothetical protein